MNFNIYFEIEHEAGHLLKIKYDWISPQGDSYELKDTETSQFKEWTLLKIEGEELQPVIDPTVPLEKPKKVAPPIKGSKVVEEIIDNRPRTV